jgi:hypothetical protein
LPFSRASIAIVIALVAVVSALAVWWRGRDLRAFLRERWTIVLVEEFLFLVSQVNAQEKLTLKNQKEKVSYIIGMDIGTNLKKQSMDIDPAFLARGMKDALAGAKPMLTEQEIQATMAVFQKENDGKANRQWQIRTRKKGRQSFPRIYSPKHLRPN